MRNHLLIRPIPYPDETAASILIRATELNGHANPSHMIKSTGRLSVFTSTIKNRVLFHEVALRLGLSIDINTIIPQCRGTRSDLGIHWNHNLSKTLFRDDATAYCPDCLTQETYWKNIWLFKPYYACILHKKLLLDHCFYCCNPLKTSRARLHICETCGFDLRQARSKTVDTSNIEWTMQILDDGHQEVINKVYSFWIAHWQVSKNKSIDSETERTSACINFLINKTKAIKQITALITGNPRIELLPFLKSQDKEVTRISRKIISLIPLEQYKNNKNHTKPTLTRIEARLALGITDAHLEKLYPQEQAFPTKKKSKAAIYHVEKLLAAFYNEKEHAETSPTNVAPSSGWISITKAAEILSTNESTVRSLLKNNRLQGQQFISNKIKKTLVKKTSTANFDKKYILIGSLAKQLNIAPNNLNEKLASIHILPIGGPYIDGTLVHFYRRADVGNLTKQYIDSIYKYQTKTGRPALGAVREAKHPTGLISLSNAAKKLGISVQKALLLIEKQILQKSEFPFHQTLVTEKSLSSLKSKLDKKDLIPLDDAASSLQMSVFHLKLNYVSTGIIKIENYHLWQFITTKSLKRLVQIKAKSITATEASKLLRSHRSFMANLTKAGQITSTIHEKNRKIRLYDRVDFTELLKQLDSLILN